jgi:membrane associated rhomboid family serine protease
MWKFLGSLVSGFLLLRDIFGYLIPGLAFVALVSPLFFTPDPVASIIASPEWLPVIALIIAGYLAGHVLAAFGYMLFDLIDGASPPPSAEPLYYRYLYPQIFTEFDRRDTIQILRIALAVGVVLGCALNLAVNVYEGAMGTPIWALWVGGIVVGLLMLINAHTGQRKTKEFGTATIEAAKQAETKGRPPFSWNGGGDDA